MMRDHRVWLGILGWTAVIPLLILIILTLQGIISNGEQISRFRSLLSESESPFADIPALTIERDKLSLAARERKLNYFPPETLSYFDFVEFVTTAGKNRGVEIIDYQTLTGTVPPALSLTAAGVPETLLSYIAFLEGFDKEIPFSSLTISRQSEAESYRMAFTILYKSIDSTPWGGEE